MFILYNHILFSVTEDYTALTASTITFSPEQTYTIVSVTIVDDDVLEGVEQFTVEVVATGGQERVDVGDAANISISNDDCMMTSVSTPSIVTHCLFMRMFLQLCGLDSHQMCMLLLSLMIL